MRKKLHHIGIVLPSMEAANEFLDKFGFEKESVSYTESNESYFIFTKALEGEPPLEIMVPTGGVLAAYNKGKGGIHHIAIEVEDVEAVSREFEAKGLQMLYEEASRPVDHVLCNFVRPKYGNGILVEFIQNI